MGLLTPRANGRYGRLEPTPDPIEAPGNLTTTDSWPETGRWELPGTAYCVFPTEQGGCWVGGTIEEDSTAVGYVTYIDPQSEARTRRFEGARFSSERVVDFDIATDGVLALSTVGNDAHRLIRLTRNGEVRSVSQIHRRGTPLSGPQLFSVPGRNELLLAGTVNEGSSWEGVAVIHLDENGVPQWHREYGYGEGPGTVRSNGQMLATPVSRITQRDITSKVMTVDENGLRYRRGVPHRSVFDFRWVSDSEADTLLVGATYEGEPGRGYVARLDASGHPKWWRNISISDRPAALNSVVQTDGVYRVQGSLHGDDETDYFELVVNADGERRSLHAIPPAVFGGNFGPKDVFVPKFDDGVRLVRYRDVNRLTAGSLS